MPVRYADPVAIFEGLCAPEEADALLEWLRRIPEPVADLGACEAPHTALVQLLLAAKVRLAAPPPDPVFAACLAAHLPRAAVAEPAVQDKASSRAGHAARKQSNQNRPSRKARTST